MSFAIAKIADLPPQGAEAFLARRQHLLDLGFPAETIMVWEEATPKLFTEQFVDEKLAGLLARGFTDPVKLITSLPSILGLAFENIDAKLAGLLARGFTDPVKLITSSPSILGYAFENIDAKLAFGRHMGVDVIPLIESFPPFLSYNLKRIALCTRLAIAIDGDPRTVVLLLSKHLDTIVAAFLANGNELTRGALVRAARECPDRDQNLETIAAHPTSPIARSFNRYVGRAL